MLQHRKCWIIEGTCMTFVSVNPCIWTCLKATCIWKLPSWASSSSKINSRQDCSWRSLFLCLSFSPSPCQKIPSPKEWHNFVLWVRIPPSLLMLSKCLSILHHPVSWLQKKWCSNNIIAYMYHLWLWNLKGKRICQNVLYCI